MKMKGIYVDGRSERVGWGREEMGKKGKVTEGEAVRGGERNGGRKKKGRKRKKKRERKREKDPKYRRKEMEIYVETGIDRQTSR